MGTLSLITKNVKEENLDLYEDLRRGTTENYIVGHSQWDNFFKQQVTTMKPGERKYYFIGTSKHAMVCTLSFKAETDIEGERYAVNFYDPNNIAVHKRVVSSMEGDTINSEGSINKLTAQEFISPHRMELYYGKAIDGEPSQHSCFTVVPNDFGRPDKEGRRLSPEESNLIEPKKLKYSPNDMEIDQLPESNPPVGANIHSQSTDVEMQESNPQTQPNKQRTVEMFLSPAEEADHTIAYQLMYAGLPLDWLEEKLDKCKTPDERISLLKGGTSTDRSTGMSQAIGADLNSTIRKWGSLVLDQYKKGNLNAEHVEKLLEMSHKNGVRGFHMAFIESRSITLKSLGKLMLDAKKEGALDNKKLMDLLTARPESLTDGLKNIPQTEHKKKIKTYGNILQEANQEGLDTSQITALLESTSNGTPYFNDILKEGTPLTVTAFGSLLIEFNKNNALGTENLMKLLAAKDSNNTSGIFNALQKNDKKSLENKTAIEKSKIINNTNKKIKSFGDMLIIFHEEGLLTKTQMIDLMTNGDESEMSNLLEKTNPEISETFTEILDTIKKLPEKSSSKIEYMQE